MIGNSESSPVMDKIWLQLENTKSSLNMTWMISDLDLHGCNVLQQLNILWLESISVLETF